MNRQLSSWVARIQSRVHASAQSRAWQLTLAALLLLCSCATSDGIHSVRFAPDQVTAGTDAASSTESLVLPTTTCGDYFIAETYIDGAGPFAMLLDSGASVTTISPATATAADVLSRITEIDIGGLHIDGRIRCAVFDLDHLSDALGTEIDGILGHQVFRLVLLTYDYPAHQIRVRRGALTDDLPGIAPMSTSARPMLGARIGDRKINVLLDTGSSSGLSLAMFDQLDFAGAPRAVGASMQIDGLHEVRAARVADDVTFGSFTLCQPVVRDASRVSLLGQQFLRTFVLTLDQQRGRIQIVHPDGTASIAPIPCPPLYGVGCLFSPSHDRVVVRRVFADSPAEAAGLQPEDVLIAVNGSLLSDLGCRWRDTINDRPVQATYLIERAGDPLQITLTTDVLVP